MKSNLDWKNKIASALMEKGFTKKGASKTAKSTMKRSIQTRERKENAPLHGKVKVIMKNGILLTPISASAGNKTDSQKHVERG